MLSFFKRPITKDESRDTGMAMVLLLLLLHLASKRDGIIYGAMTFHVMNMTVPQFFKPVASVWLGISHLLGIVVSKIILSIVFFAIITPIAVLRRLMGKDSLKLRGFKASTGSAMIERNHTFTSSDIVRPY